MKVTQVIKEAITARVKAKYDEANKSSNLLLKNDIILELELGTTKPTLESLLNNITF